MPKAYELKVGFLFREVIGMLGEWPIDDVLHCSFLELSLLINDYESVRLRLLRISLRFSEWFSFVCRSLKRGPRVPKRMVCFRKNFEHKIRWPSWPIPKVSV